jgi:hypothetical protein
MQTPDPAQGGRYSTAPQNIFSADTDVRYISSVSWREPGGSGVTEASTRIAAASGGGGRRNWLAEVST